MNRRKFLRSGSLAAAVVAGLPAAAMSFKQESPASTYKSKPEPGKEGQTLYEVIVYHNGFDHFASATADQKMITVKVGYFATADLSAPTTTGVFQYIINEVSVKGDAPPLWTISTRFDKKISGEYKFDKNFPKNLKFRCSKFGYIEILGKDGVSIVSIPYPPATSGDSDGDCFLSTACVEHKQLADNCEELQTLRFLRDHIMLKNPEGTLLVKQYAITGPHIVNAINRCSNKAEIYEYMYSNMIQPSVKMVSMGYYEAAVRYYQDFVKALLKKYG